nr:chorismate mutase 3, chloroplastic-like [Quercus suber]
MESKLLEVAITSTPAHITFKSSRPIFHFASKATFISPESNFVANGCCPIQASFSSTTTSSSSFPIRLVKKKRVDESETLTLPFIRHSLIRQEDSIIVSLLERAQYCYNADTYNRDAFTVDSFNGSLVEFMVREIEKLHAQVGRYKNPDELPFFPADLPESMLPPLQYPQVQVKVGNTVSSNDVELGTKRKHKANLNMPECSEIPELKKRKSDEEILVVSDLLKNEFGSAVAARQHCRKQ